MKEFKTVGVKVFLAGVKGNTLCAEKYFSLVEVFSYSWKIQILYSQTGIFTQVFISDMFYIRVKTNYHICQTTLMVV